jgi:methionyl-tRNA formyltransferase
MTHDSMRARKITLFLMTEKGLRFLSETSPEFKHMFGLVVVGADKAIQKDFEEEIIEQCKLHELTYVKRADFAGAIETEYAMAISWRWLINHPSERLIVFHDSILPRYRGFAPLVNSLINAEPEIGVTAIYGASDFDTGDIIAQSSSPVSYPLTIGDAISMINDNYAACGREILAQLCSGDVLVAKRQQDSEASYSVWLDDHDYRIDWSTSAQRIRRFVDAVGYPYMGAYSTVEGVTVRITKCEAVPDVKIENRHPGKVLFVKDGCPVVVCGDGLIMITEASTTTEGAQVSFLPVKRFRIRFI